MNPIRFRSALVATVTSLAWSSLALTGCGGKSDINYIGAGGDGSSSGSDCGNGTIDTGEECDDSNSTAGDGCSASCQAEPGYVCNKDGCNATCGNGKLDSGETCEDGGAKDGDGCDANCQIEGSCAAPLVLDLKPDKNGVPQVKLDSSTSGGGTQVAAADCDGDSAGAAPDRVFELNLDAEATVTAKVEAPFNSIIRLLEEPCKVAATDACVNDGGAGADETLTVKLPAGKHYIVVDGTNDKADGEFTLTVRAECPVDSVKLDRVNYFSGYTQMTLRNTSATCTVNISRLGLTTLRGGTSNVDITLPSKYLKPGETVTLQPNVPSGYDDFVELSVQPVAQPYGGGILLCDGPCDDSKPETIIDAFLLWDGTYPEYLPTLPTGVGFSPEAIKVSNYSTWYSAYTYMERVAYNGQNPSFLRSDWRPTFRVDAKRNPVDESYLYFSPTGKLSVYDDATDGKVMRVQPNAVLNLTLPADFAAAKHFQATLRCVDSISSDDGCGLFHMGDTSMNWAFANYGYDSGGPGWYLNWNLLGDAAADTWHDMAFTFGTSTTTFDAKIDGDSTSDVPYYSSGAARQLIEIGNWSTVVETDYSEIVVY